MDSDQAPRRQPRPPMNSAQPENAAARYPDLRGRVAVVTGAAKGIGQGIARRLAAEGMRVVVGDKDVESLTATVSELRSAGGTVEGVYGDLSRDEGIAHLFDGAVAAFGTVDLLVNNAADLHRSRLLDEHAELLELQLATNVRGPYLCSQRAAAIMREAGGGSIIHITSVGALRAHHRGFPYDVTKGAINAMTLAMAVDLGEYVPDRGNDHARRPPGDRTGDPAAALRNGRRHRSDGGIPCIVRSELRDRAGDLRRRRNHCPAESPRARRPREEWIN